MCAECHPRAVSCVRGAVQVCRLLYEFPWDTILVCIDHGSHRGQQYTRKALTEPGIEPQDSRLTHELSTSELSRSMQFCYINLGFFQITLMSYRVCEDADVVHVCRLPQIQYHNWMDTFEQCHCDNSVYGSSTSIQTSNWNVYLDWLSTLVHDLFVLVYMYQCFCISLSIPVYKYQSICISLTVSVHLYQSFCVCTSPAFSGYLYQSFCICLSVSVFLYLSICISLSVSVYLYQSFCICQSVSVYLYLSMHQESRSYLYQSFCICLSVSVYLY